MKTPCRVRSGEVQPPRSPLGLVQHSPGQPHVRGVGAPSGCAAPSKGDKTTPQPWHPPSPPPTPPRHRRHHHDTTISTTTTTTTTATTIHHHRHCLYYHHHQQQQQQQQQLAPSISELVYGADRAATLGCCLNQSGT